MFTTDENEILLFLKPLGKQFATSKEVCRRAGGKEKWNEDPEWAKPILKRMEAQGVLEINELGHYRIKRKEEEEEGSIPLDPRIRQILSKSSMDFSKSYILKDPQDYRLPSENNGGDANKKKK